MPSTPKNSLCLLLIISPYAYFSSNVHADSLIKGYTVAPRHETYGVESIGYPQICIRTNMPDQRIDMQGIFDELSSKYHPSMLLPEATKLAASGKLGHVWTIFFDSPDSWKSWSFRFPGMPTANALHVNNWYDGPERPFNYQHCVSTKNQPTDSEYVMTNYIKPLIQESRDIAKLIYPHFEFTGGVYSPATPCVWFATKLFNKVTGLDIPFEQKLDWNKVSAILNEPSFSNLETIPDAGVVAEAISKKIKFTSDVGKTTALFTHNNAYQLFYFNKFIEERHIKLNSYVSQISPFYAEYKTALQDKDRIILIDYQNNVSEFNIRNQTFNFQKHPFNQTFYGDINLNPKLLKGSMPLYRGMPGYSKDYNQHLLFLENGETYLLNAKTMRITANHYFEQNAPHLLPYVKSVLSTEKSNEETVYVFLSDRKYIEVRINDFSIIDGEKPIEQHPVYGNAFKLH